MKVLLAVSGGIDSMYLANKAPELFPGASFAVAHCNFHLRGKESDGDEAFVREWCTGAGVECHVRSFDTTAYAQANGISIEMAARDLRYGWFAELCRDNGYDGVAVAHNANDNAETLMLNLLRGTGTRGIRGMSQKACIGGATVLRPMLDVSRESIAIWMQNNGKAWREDRTNSENEYKRNRIRNEVFPLFAAINPAFLKTLGRDMENFAMVDDIAESYFREALDKVAVENGYSVSALLQLEHWKYVLWRLMEPLGMSAETLEKFIALLERYRTEPSGTVTLSGKTFQSPTHLVSVERRTILVKKKQGQGE